MGVGLNEISVPMAIADFLPVLLCGFAVYNYIVAFYLRMSDGQRACFAAGGILLVISGAFKAIWKLLYALKICDVHLFSEQMLFNNAVAFVLLALSTWSMLFKNKSMKEIRMYSAAAIPVIATHVPYIVGMAVGMMFWYIGLMVASMKWNYRKTAFLLFVAMLFAFGQSALGAIFDNSPLMHWIAEAMNIAGMFVLYHSGYKFRKMVQTDDRGY